MALSWRERRSAKGLRHIERQIKLGLTAQQYRAKLRAEKKARKEAWAAELAKGRQSEATT